MCTYVLSSCFPKSFYVPLDALDRFRLAQCIHGTPNKATRPASGQLVILLWSWMMWRVFCLHAITVRVLNVGSRDMMISTQQPTDLYGNEKKKQKQDTKGSWIYRLFARIHTFSPFRFAKQTFYGVSVYCLLCQAFGWIGSIRHQHSSALSPWFGFSQCSSCNTIVPYLLD